MSYQIKQINPTKCTFAYLLGEYDCYELRKGICSLYLSEEEAQKVYEKEKDQYFGQGDVMNCRDLAKSLLKVKYYEDKIFQERNFAIYMHRRSCGHYVFTDGQHRTCIAKHLNIQSMYANVEEPLTDDTLNCSACYQKEEDKAENKKIKNKILSMLKLKHKKRMARAKNFIDEEQMNYKEF